MQDYRLNPVSIILRHHKRKELNQIYFDIFGDYPSSTLTHTELVHELSKELSVDDILESWEDKFFAYNTSFKFYRVKNSLTDEAIENGLRTIKGKFEADAWKKLNEKGYVPHSIRGEGVLIHVSEMKNKTYFLFATPGRSKEIIEDLKVRYIPQPQFTVAIWYNKEAVLQIRGLEHRDFVTAKLREYLWVKQKIEPTFIQVSIDDKAKVKSLTVKLGGKANRGKFVKVDDENPEAIYTAAPDKDLYDTKKVKQAEKEGYSQDSAGIDFVYNGETYTVWVGFSNDTFWVRAGDVNEALLDYLQEKVLLV